MAKNECVKRICNLPLYFESLNKSAFELVIESGYKTFYKEISSKDIKSFLKANIDLIDKWQIWSENKRVDSGFYLDTEKMLVGKIVKSKKESEEKFSTALDACSEFILKELAGILNIQG